MAASTASICLRKESLSVHSQSNLQDSSRFNQYLLRLVQGLRVIVPFNRLETPTREAGQSPDVHYRAFMAGVRGGVVFEHAGLAVAEGDIGRRHVAGAVGKLGLGFRGVHP